MTAVRILYFSKLVIYMVAIVQYIKPSRSNRGTIFAILVALFLYRNLSPIII